MTERKPYKYSIPPIVARCNNVYKTSESSWDVPPFQATKKKILLSCKQCNKKVLVKRSLAKRVREIGFGCSKLCNIKLKAKKYSCKNSSDTKHSSKNSFLKTIDTEEKAYFLGWIASASQDHSDGFCLSTKHNNVELLSTIRDLFDKNVPIVPKKESLLGFSINNIEISRDIYKHLKIKPGINSNTVYFPQINSSLSRHFIRGLFDAGGSVNKTTGKKAYTSCNIISNSSMMKEGIQKHCLIKSSIPNKSNRIFWSHASALDFLGWIYYGCNPQLRLHRKYERYIDWCSWVPSLSGQVSHGKQLCFKWSKSRTDAVPPQKTRISDSGYDLTIIDIIKKVSDVTFFDTGIKVQPDFGWYFDIIPRSSLSKTGWMLANSIGVIDRTYRGTVIVALRKVDKEAPELTLPFRAVQMLPRPIAHLFPVEVSDLDETERSDGGFGSTGER